MCDNVFVSRTVRCLVDVSLGRRVATTAVVSFSISVEFLPTSSDHDHCPRDCWSSDSEQSATFRLVLRIRHARSIFAQRACQDNMEHRAASLQSLGLLSTDMAQSEQGQF